MRRFNFRDVMIFALAVLLVFGAVRTEFIRSDALRQQRNTIRLLCDNVPITDGLVESILALFPKNDKGLSERAQQFKSELQAYHLDLLDQISNPESPCVKLR